VDSRRTQGLTKHNDLRLAEQRTTFSEIATSMGPPGCQ
jgi:hypothetical protein